MIIPAYNTEPDYFEQCINSLVAQTFSDIEIIIVDDGSDAEHAAIYDTAASSDDRIKVIHKQNQGVSEARNTGVRAAHAKWIMFVDSDDWIELNTCERLNSVLSANECEVLLFDHIKEYSNGVRKRAETGLAKNTLHYMEDVRTKEKLYRRAMGTPNQGNETLSTIYYSVDKVFLKDYLLKNELVYPAGLPKSEDKVFILRCFEKMHSMYYLNEAFYHYRINVLSVSNKYSPSVDKERRDLSVYLEEIARRMDSEMAQLTGDPSYNRIYKDYMRFVFGIISDVLFSKYYHKDYPGTKKQRNKEVKEFLSSDPFRESIEYCSYKDLGNEAKIKKFMLSHGLTTLFCEARRAKRRAMGQVGQ